MKVAFYTLGCKVNQYETQALKESFAKRGHTVVSEDAQFDAIVINSCTVTAESDRKTRQTVRRFRKASPEAAIVLTGCMVQAFPDDATALGEVDVITGNTNPLRLIELTERFLADGERVIEVGSHKPRERFNTPAITEFAERTRAYLKIEDGCDRFCSYCIIPTARGRVRSKPLEEIRAESEAIAANGFREIVLVGINLSAYGKNEEINICDAVDTVCAIEGISRVRLGSLEPDHISDEMLLRLKKQEKFCPQFHLSLQSGCDRILKQMNRHYDTAFYRDLVERIRKIFPGAAITTDIMVGFPGETEEDFLQSLAFAEEIGFAKTHVFAYSRRKGTVAYGLDNQVSRAEKERRSIIMIKAAEKSEQAFLESQTGRIFPVLFETAQEDIQEGYTPNYSRVRLSCAQPLTGQIRNVRLVSAENGYCTGEIV